jgi:hypothetical protein
MRGPFALGAPGKAGKGRGIPVRYRPNPDSVPRMTERALEAVSKAVREATWAFEREMLEVRVEDLPTPVIRKLSAATDALAAVLLEAEGFRGAVSDQPGEFR